METSEFIRLRDEELLKRYKSDCIIKAINEILEKKMIEHIETNYIRSFIYRDGMRLDYVGCSVLESFDDTFIVYMNFCVTNDKNKKRQDSLNKAVEEAMRHRLFYLRDNCRYRKKYTDVLMYKINIKKWNFSSNLNLKIE